MQLDCPNVETCGGTIRLSRHDEWDTNVHDYEIEEMDCACELTDAQGDALRSRAHAAYMAGEEDPWLEPDY